MSLQGPALDLLLVLNRIVPYSYTPNAPGTCRIDIEYPTTIQVRGLKGKPKEATVSPWLACLGLDSLLNAHTRTLPSSNLGIALTK